MGGFHLKNKCLDHHKKLFKSYEKFENLKMIYKLFFLILQSNIIVSCVNCIGSRYYKQKL